MRNSSSSSGSQAPLWMSNSSVRLALVASVAWTAPVGQAPEQEAVDGAEGQRRRLRRGRARRARCPAARLFSLRRNKDRAAARCAPRPSPRAVPGRRRHRPCGGPARRSRDGWARRSPVPEQRGLALVGDADRGDVGGVARRPGRQPRAAPRRNRARCPRRRAPPSRRRGNAAAGRAARSRPGADRVRERRWRGSRWCPGRGPAADRPCREAYPGDERQANERGLSTFQMPVAIVAVPRQAGTPVREIDS